MPPRSGPRSKNVRTGCITCKRRRVKCSEERPTCARCIRGDFVCAGYDPPKAWIFHGIPEAQKHANKTHSRSALLHNSPPADSCDLPTRPVDTSQRTAIPPFVLMQSSLQHGNSDPFNCYAVPIGPREVQILQVLQKFVTPPRRPSRLIDTAVDDIKKSYLDSLTDQATAYSILARDTVFQDLMRNGRQAIPSTLSLDYVVRSQAALCQKLQALMNGTESSRTAHTVMWTTTHLAATDIITGDSSAHFHIRALRKFVARYVELVGDNLETTAISSLIYVDNMKALVTLARPVLSPDHWSPYLFQDSHHARSTPRAGINGSNLATNSVHRAVRDETLKTVIINQRDGIIRFNDLLGADLGSSKGKALLIALRGSELIQSNQLFHVLADALELLRKPGLTPEQVQDQSARAYLSLSIFLWSQLASSATITLNTPFDLASSTLRRLKSVLIKSKITEILSPRHEKSYAEARLWALHVGVCTELSQQDVLDSGLVCGDWFLETFRDEANSLHVHSWQHAVTVFELFLYNEKVDPHMSRWWDRVSPNGILI